MCENNYGWCLMQEGKYNKALLVYDELLKKLDKTNGNKHILDIYNNIANCYIFLNKQSQANKLLANSFKIENDNKRAMYLKCVSLLNDFVNGGNVSSYKVYKMFNKLIEKNSSETCINSGWFISAVNLYEQTKNEKVKENIVKKIKYSSEPISMKSFIKIADFIQKQLDGSIENDTLYREFCQIKLVQCGENKAFQILMNSVDFHFFKKEDRAFIICNIVQMYKYILCIKNDCRVTYDEKGNIEAYHYTKLSTLISLLVQQDDKPPRLRLWNSSYMNDAYEGKVFDKLLSQTDTLKDTDIIKMYVNDSENSILQTDSNVYITSFSTVEDSFQMWNIYGDHERGVAIKFDEGFFNIKDKYYDMILDDGDDEYALYKVKYLDINNIGNNTGVINNLEKIAFNLSSIETRLKDIRLGVTMEEYESFKNAETEVRAFISDRLNEVRFLFKTKSYEYESELRLIRCSHKSYFDNKNFLVPRLYINVDKEIESLDVKIGSKLERQKIRDTLVWLKNTGKVKNVEMFSLTK